ncbi:MAG TPA: SIS domain-containing protein [Dehalococcoidia bacterium]|jgi:arabinose-5-phosphate isomerase
MNFDRDQERHILLGREVIRNEARALDQTADGLGHDFVEAVEMIASTHAQIIATGVGKSGQVARKIAAMLSSTGTPAAFVHAGEAIHGDLGGFRKGDVVVAVSHSGETPEVVALLPMLKRLEAQVIAITDNPRSTLSLVANVVVQPGAASGADPIGLAPTASSAAAMAIGDAIALAVAQHRGLTAADFAHHPGGALGKLMQAVYDRDE